MGRQAFRRRHPLVSDCSTQSDCGGAGGTPPGFAVWGTYWGRKMALASPGEEEWHSKRDTGQLFPPLTCYPTQGKRLAQRREGFQCVAQLCRCLPERHCAPMHRRRQHSMWREPSPPGGTARLGIGTQRRWHPLSSGPTSAWRQPSLSANLCSRQKLLRASEALTDSSSSTGPHCSPARKIERSQEGTRGGLGGCNLLAPLRNLTMRSCLPRNRPSTAS